MKSKTIRFAAVAAILIILHGFICLLSGASAKADVAASPRSEIVTAYESQNVWTDLQGATIDGEGIDLNLYNFDEHKNVQIISFVEFCYSFYAEKQSDYGLYVYVYNPRGLDFTKNTLLNKIEFRVGAVSEHFFKQNLQFLNRSNNKGYEGLFYKFKVAMSPAERAEVLNALNSSARVYEVSGIELCSEGMNATDYHISNVYTYTGYAKGYGAPSSDNDTLNCTVDGFDKYLSLDVHPTFYRPEGTHSDGYTRDTLHSVYFSVPNEMITENGEITAVHAQWLNALTAPILVTGNKNIYNAIYPYLGVEVNGVSVSDFRQAKIPYAIVASTLAKESMSSERAASSGYYAYNTYTDWSVGGGIQTTYDNIITNLRYLFYAENGDADSYVLPREKVVGDKAKGVKGWLQTYTEEYGSKTVPLVNGKYARELFEQVDEKFTDINIKADKKYHLTDNIVSNSLWDILFGTQLKGEHGFDLSAIQPVTQKDVENYPDKKIFCDKFYVAERDYENFCTFISDVAKKEKPETVYLFRYYQSEYECHEATEFKIVQQGIFNYGGYIAGDTNAYISKSWVQLDFDVIDLTFTQKNVDTVIPCISSPMDIIADIEHPVDPQPDKSGPPWWVWVIVAATGVIIILCIIPGGLRAVGKLLFWIIVLPFRILWNVICAPFRMLKNRREKRKKAVEKELARAEKRKQRERQKNRLPATEEPAERISSQPKAAPKKRIAERFSEKLKSKPKSEKKAPPASELRQQANAPSLLSSSEEAPKAGKANEKKESKERGSNEKARPRKTKAAKDTPRGSD